MVGTSRNSVPGSISFAFFEHMTGKVVLLQRIPTAIKKDSGAAKKILWEDGV